MRSLKLKVFTVLILLCATAWGGGFLLGRASRPAPCQACAHPEHGNETCCRQVPCVIGTVGCTCQGMELRPKQFMLGSQK